MDKIKSFFSNIYANLTLILGAIIGILVYYINLKHKEANALKAQIDLTKTQKEADLLEADINRKLENKNLLKKELDELEKAKVQLAEQRNKISKVQSGKTPDEAEDYWNKN